MWGFGDGAAEQAVGQRLAGQYADAVRGGVGQQVSFVFHRMASSLAADLVIRRHMVWMI
jgi:hypothetical protein